MNSNDNRCWLYSGCPCRAGGCYGLPDNGCPVYRWFRKLIEESDWISVKKRLPEKDKDVIIYGYYVGPSGKTYPTTIISDIEEFKHCECVPVAWMPVPGPPKELTNADKG